MTAITTELARRLARQLMDHSLLRTGRPDLGSEGYEATEDGGVGFSIRYLGRWVRPAGSDDEDCDWMEPTEQTTGAVIDVTQAFEKAHEGVKVTVGSGEKNYMYFSLRSK